MVRWGLAVDLKGCVGCQTCTMACKLDNATPPTVLWRNVRDVEVGSYPDVRRFFLPVQCMHCANPACMEVCPTKATRRRSDGIVYIDYEKCMGCGFCVLACPYDARWLLKEQIGYFQTGGASPGNHRPLGVATKCDLCFDRIDTGTSSGKLPGTNPEATPVCVNSCPAKALVFGDLDDPESELSKTIRARNSTRLRPEIGTDPSVYYLW